jgi:hypothetical protein
LSAAGLSAGVSGLRAEGQRVISNDDQSSATPFEVR